MQNTHFSSSLYSVRSQGSLSYSFNDYSYLLNERFERNPINPIHCSSSKSCCCCNCCEFSIRRVPINPCYLYGLRQSTLLQWSASRRLVLGGGDRCGYRVQECRPDWGCCGLPCSVRERSVCDRRGRRRNGKCSCVVDGEGEGGVYDSGDLDDAEAMLSLLSEEVGEECFWRGGNGVSFKRVDVEGRRSLSGRGRNVSSSKRVEEESRRSLIGRERKASSSKRMEQERRSLIGRERNESSSKRAEGESRRISIGRERNGGLSKRVEVERRSVGGREKNGSLSKGVQVDIEQDNSSECNSRKKKSNVRVSTSESNSKRQFGSATVDLSEGDFRQKEERGMILRGENRSGMKGGSSSSYYSLSSSGDFGSEADAQDKHGLFGESASSVYEDSKFDIGGRFDGQVIEDNRKYRDDSKGKGETTKQRSAVVDGGVMWDWRKKTEKKLTEVVAEETEAGGKSSEMPSRVSKTNLSELGEASGSRKQFDDQRESSYLTKGTREQYSQIGNQVVGVGVTDSRRKFQECNESEIHGSEVETTFLSQERLSGREENLAIATNLVQERQEERHDTAGYIGQQEELNRDHQKISKISHIQVVDVQRISDRRRETDIRRIYQEEKANMLSNSANETDAQLHEIGQQVIGLVDSGRKSPQITEVSETCDSNIERANIVQPETRITNQVGQSHLVPNPSGESSQPCPKIDEKAFQRILSGKGTADEKRIQVKPTKEAQSDSGEASSFQASLDVVSQATMQPHNVEGHKRSPRAMLLPPPSQLIARGSLRIESSSGTTTQGVSEEILDSRSPALRTHSGKQTSALHQESSCGSGNSENQGEILYLIPEDALGSTCRMEKSSSQFVRGFVQKVRHEVSTSENQNENTVSSSGNGNTQTQGEILYLVNPEDALDSAHRLEKSSSQFVGELSDRARHEVSTSENKDANTVSEAKLVHGGEKNGQVDFSQNRSEDSQTKGNDTRRSSVGSGTKGPADEMWDVTDTSVLKTPKLEKSDATTTSGDAVVKRTGRSIWNIVADIVRLRWSSHAETPHSAVRLGGRISSNESASSEAWFSGHETEDNNEKNTKREKDLQHRLQPSKSFPQSGKDKVRYLEAGTPPSPNKEESGLTSKVISTSSSERALGSKENQKSFRGSSGIEKVESSQPLTASGVKPAVVEEISNASNIVSGSGSMEHMDQFGSQKLNEGVSDNVQTSGELKQRKFQRSTQVLRDRFDEWEEAHTLEIEQRKMDEMFMREALLEAKKAADNWEVPVGAVLVQQGKIVARGCNLVEELRDSTAHAEMICIREASNVLRSWRLSETTLYVTLEPCPMCAGAILQARVDTVVWGAPNKLLGADGSWIRLFPDGGEGNSSEHSDKPAPPVHPFHPNMTIRRGVLASDCADIMQQFFQLRRRKKEKQADPAAAPPHLHRISLHPSKLITKMHRIFHIMFCL
ncbi:tRNA(adenine(34)) deaminase, chloroplastic-like [Pyrus communis]|uniref:tRNA(adenine(34)) deaminase, chloroplastic-like n=1 Tax=Pyrus communis TaxID=23211 RepID=UPI0035C14B24